MGLYLRHKNFYQPGFTLIETLVATGIIVVGLVSAMALINTSLFYVFNISNRLIAAHLTAEGIELVRNNRDNNWLQNLAWNNGLADGDYQIAYDLVSPSAYSGDHLLLDLGTGFYGYSSGLPTHYLRKISISNLSSYEILVISTVTWQVKGVTYNSSAEEHLFDWK